MTENVILFHQFQYTVGALIAPQTQTYHKGKDFDYTVEEVLSGVPKLNKGEILCNMQQSFLSIFG